MKPLGALVLIAGVILGIYALSLDTSVQVDYQGYSYGMPERVNNLGLMARRQNLLAVSGVMILAGVALAVAASRKPGGSTGNTGETFRETLEKAKKAEFAEDYGSALRLYLETIYHLENDFSSKKINDEWNRSRLALIESLRKKTEELRARKQ